MAEEDEEAAAAEGDAAEGNLTEDEEEVDERKAASGLLRRRCEATLACGDKAGIGTTTPDASDVADPAVADEPLLPPSRAFLRSLALMF